MKVFWFDTETSGTDPHKHGIIQLAYTLEIDGEAVEEGELTSNCNGKEIDPRALEINNYTEQQVKGFPPKERMYEKLHALFSKHVNKYERTDKLIAGGYNVDFDLRFLRRLWFDCGDKYFGSFFAFASIDPSSLFRALQWKGVLDPIIKLTLSDMADYLGVSTEGAHDAAEDVRMTREVSSILMNLAKGV